PVLSQEISTRDRAPRGFGGRQTVPRQNANGRSQADLSHSVGSCRISECMDQRENRPTEISPPRSLQGGDGSRMGLPDLQHQAVDPLELEAQVGSRGLRKGRKPTDRPATNVPNLYF